MPQLSNPQDYYIFTTVNQLPNDNETEHKRKGNRDLPGEVIESLPSSTSLLLRPWFIINSLIFNFKPIILSTTRFFSFPYSFNCCLFFDISVLSQSIVAVIRHLIFFLPQPHESFSQEPLGVHELYFWNVLMQL